MKFIQYLLTEGRRSKPIKIDDAFKWIKKNAKKSFESSKKGNIIYRGLQSDSGSLLVDPMKGKPRKSAYVGSNYYTLLLDNLSSWKQYPKRSKSIICTTDKHKAEDYGSAYIVLPKDGSKIGVCPDDDIFTSFKYLFSKSQNSYMGEWSTDMSALSTNLGLKNSDKNWKSILKLFKTLDDTDTSGVNWWPKYLSGGDSLKTMEDLLDPRKNKFALKKSGDILPYDREVWTDGESIMLSPYIWEELSNIDIDDIKSDFVTDVKIKDMLILYDDIQRADSDMYDPNYRNTMDTHPTAVNYDGKWFIIEGHGSIIVALMQGKTTMDIKIQWHGDNYPHGEKWKYKDNLKYKGLEDFSSDDIDVTQEDIEDNKNDWGY